MRDKGLGLTEQVKRLKPALAGLQDILWRDRQPLGPAGRVSVVKVGDNPEAGDNVLFSPLGTLGQVGSKGGQ